MSNQDVAIGIVIAISLMIVAIVSLMFSEIYSQRTEDDQSQPIIDLRIMQEPSSSPSY